MSNICQRKGNFPPPQISEYEAIFERVNRGLFEIYTYCLAQGIPWCKIRPGLWDASEEDIQIHLANKGTSKPLPVVLPVQSKTMPPMKAPPSKKGVPQKRPLPSLVDLELMEIASGPPSSDERPPARKVLPPPRVMEIVSGPPSSDQRPPDRKVLPPPRVKPAPPIPKDPRVSSTPYRPETFVSKARCFQSKWAPTTSVSTTSLESRCSKFFGTKRTASKNKQMEQDGIEAFDEQDIIKAYIWKY